MWKHKNFINLQLYAPPPITYTVEVSINGVIVSLNVGDNEQWDTNQEYNSNKYTISNGKVVWSDGTILQYNGVDVLPTDNIIGSIGSPGIYTTRSATPTLTFKHFFDAGLQGTGTYKFRHYSQQEPSSEETWVLNETLTLTPNTFSVDFTANNSNYTEIWMSDRELAYGDSSNVVYATTGGWIDEANKTLVFASAPTGDLLTWLQANGTKQGGGGRVIKAGTYRWKASLPLPSAGTSIDQEVQAKVYAFRTDDVRATILPESQIDLINISRSEDGRVAQFLELGEHELKTDFDADDNWVSDNYRCKYNDNIRIIVFDDDQLVSEEFYQYAIIDGNLEALTDWAPSSYLTIDETTFSSVYNATVNGKTASQGQVLSQGDTIVVTQPLKGKYAGYISITSSKDFDDSIDSYSIHAEDIMLVGNSSSQHTNDVTTITINYSE